MKNLRETCLPFIQNEDVRKELKEWASFLFRLIYNEIYIYIWFICFYHVFLIFLTLANLFLLLRFIRKSYVE